MTLVSIRILVGYSLLFVISNAERNLSQPQFATSLFKPSFTFKFPLILGALLIYRFKLALVPSRPGGPVFGHRAVYISFVRTSQYLAVPEIYKALNPKTEKFLIAIACL
jgi:hypothetical protein